ncbi:MAG: thiol peroxidase [Tissierella sp.]|uniref:thiol peroxidase n=1 Tax=Tissierella sp. TaxID=41274 RepID=UPI003F9E7D93
MVKTRKGIVTMGGNPLTLEGEEIKVGDTAPKFTASNNDLSEFSSESLQGKVRVFSVVPSLDTKVCQIQTNRFNKEAANLDGVEVVTISVDLPFAQARFKEENDIEDISLVSDYKDRDFGEKYGFLLEENKLLSRGIVVVGKDNKVKYVEYVKEVTDEPDYEKALEEIKKLV